MIEKFHIYNSGDPSVGIWPFEATITIEEPTRNSILNIDEIEQIKDFFYEFYDIPKNRLNCGHVLINEEFIKMQDSERKFEAEMHEEYCRESLSAGIDPDNMVE